MPAKSQLRHFRLSIDVDVLAPDRPAAEDLVTAICGLLDGRWWITEVLPNSIEERIPLG